MSILQNSKYEELCRLCASKIEMFLAINIFEDEGTIRQKIDTCLPVQVHETDELPKMICETCLYKLELFSDFRERSVRTEKLLVELYKQLSTCIQTGQQCLVPLNGNEVIMVPQHLLNNQNVSDIELSSLSQNEGQEIILGPDIQSQSLESIVTNSLGNPDFSNQTFNAQEQTSSSSKFEENLNLIHQHQLLADQFRLQQDLQLENATLPLLNDFKDISNQSNHRFDLQVKLAEHNMCRLEFEDGNKLLSLNEVAHKPDLETYRHDDSSSNSNSMNSLPLEKRLDDIAPDASMDNKQMFDLNSTSNDSLLVLNATEDCFFCNVCSRNFEHKAAFDVHCLEHFHKCDGCKSLFISLDVLNAHRRTCLADQKDSKSPLKKETDDWGSEESDNDINTFKEDAVEEQENQQQTNNDAETVESTEKKSQHSGGKMCTECGKMYKTNYKLVEHMRKHTGEKPYKCGSCDKAFRSKIGLAQHEAKHTGQYDFSCPTCGKGFQCRSYLMVHQRVHSNVKPYPCTTCGQNFKTKQSLLDHTNRHLGVKPYICDICGRGFITKGLCRAHKRVHSGLDNRKYSCDVCDKMFVSKSYLQTHQRIHTGEKPFMCEVCGKGFLTRVDLKIHSTMHTGEKSFVCEMCGKAFARRDALRCHRRSHTGERPYSCDTCGQTFTQFTPMVIHKRLHTGERPYSCETCGKAFVSRSTMLAHAKKHV
ncbi:unnamed protein product [Phyllotreta striolata]|uniref:Uncharacterized protein n=1 Tax=Phyllotreta striolata TaxID=444603 RepID=A0A9N9TFQ0_PHYSR|nr:unnamed protein product [Phyllotreta striolata]